jgi:bifunctional non-homologous end joining protein LigD
MSSRAGPARSCWSRSISDLNGLDLRKLPLFLSSRKIVGGTDIQFSESFEIAGREMFAHACKLGLEGVVSKVRDGTYPMGRTKDWVKKTCVQRETLTIAGFALDEGKWDGNYVGRRKGGDLVRLTMASTSLPLPICRRG